MAETEPDLGALRDRLRQSSLAGKAARLRPDEVKALYFLLDRALDLRANPQSLDREADGAAYIITGRFPSLDKRLRRAATDVDASADETNDNR